MDVKLKVRGLTDPTANTVFRRTRAILPKSAHAQNEYSCDTFDKLILASIDIIQTSTKFLILNSWSFLKFLILERLKFHECAS